MALPQQYISDLITIKEATRYSLRSNDSLLVVLPKGKSLSTLGERSFSTLERPSQIHEGLYLY